MDAKLNDKGGELVNVKFPMNSSPVAVQLTKHINNIFLTYPKQNKAVLSYFREYLQDEAMNVNGPAIRIRTIVDYYGKPAVKKWFRDIYGWKFKRKKKASAS